MSLSKQQTIGAACGGVFVLCAGALGYFLFDAYSTRSEKEEELADATASFTRYNEAPVFPSKKSIDSVKSNETSFADWRVAAGKLAARGDRPPPAEEEPSVFKQRLQSEVRRMLGLTGGVDGKIAAPAFLFGFEQYLGESGQLPAAADVPRLAVQLETISRTVDLFADAGVLEVKGVKRIEPKADEDEEETARRPAKKGKAKDAADDEKKPVRLDYAFEFLARPAAVVQVMNRLASDLRFAVVENFAFKESADTIVERLTAKEKADEQAASASSGAASARRRRRGAAAAFAEDAAKPEKKAIDRLVVDPETDAPILVSFTLAVYDFGTGGAAAEAAEAAPAAQADGKETH